MNCLRVLLSTFILSASFSAFAAKEDPTVATVNGEPIKLSTFLKTYNQNLLFVSDKIVTKEKVLDDLVNRKLGIMRAKKAKLQNDSVVKTKMEDILYHAQISKDLEPKLKKIVVTDKDIDDYYSLNPEYRTAHILFRVKAIPAEEEVKAAINQSLKIYNTLKRKPEKFGELANRYSQSNTAPNGGDMGFQPAMRLAPEYFGAIKGRSKGHITPPVRTQFGFHIVKVLGVKNRKSINKALYQKIVYDKKRDAVLAQYFSELRKSAKVSIEKKYLRN
jgi:parvulin-like peptidyl-prolyl isomerase